MTTIHLHGESVRMGVHLATLMYTQKAQPVDVINRIVASRPPNIAIAEFPLETIGAAVRDKQTCRRVVALRAMEVLLAKSGDPDLMTKDTLAKIATMAWQLASAMEAEEGVSTTLDSLGSESG